MKGQVMEGKIKARVYSRTLAGWKALAYSRTSGTVTVWEVVIQKGDYTAPYYLTDKSFQTWEEAFKAAYKTVKKLRKKASKKS